MARNGKRIFGEKDYSKVIDSILDTVPVFMGACKMETVKVY